jgi:hypothetical protein
MQYEHFVLHPYTGPVFQAYYTSFCMIPEASRLNMSTMAVIMKNYPRCVSPCSPFLVSLLSKPSFLSSQLAEQYASEVTDDILKHSRSNLQPGAMPSAPGQHHFLSHRTDTYNPTPTQFNSRPFRLFPFIQLKRHLLHYHVISPAI